MALVYLELFLLMAVVTATDDDWISKCGQCKCMWSDGKKTADCSSKYLSTIPTNLSDQIRYLDLSNNPIYELGPKAFLQSNLQNIQKLKLQNCSVESIHPLAFSNLGNLIELDLSKNNISKLDEEIFKENGKLRLLFLNYNRLKELRGKLFHGMPHLQRVEVNHNQIQQVDATVFDRGPVLQHIDFSENKLKRLDVKMIQNLERISSINVQGNPWICDCKLKSFRDLAMDQNWVTTPTTCAEPKRLKGQLWSSLQSRDFACAPKVLEPATDKKLEVDSPSNVTISCKVKGDPIPDVDWVTNGRIIDRDPRQNSVQKYLTFKNNIDDIIWNNLTIINVNYRDRGEYKCVAKNPAGVDEKNLTLLVYGSGSGGVPYGTNASKDMMPLYICLIVGGVVLIIVIFVLIFCCCRRKNRQLRTKGNEINQSSDYISLNGRPELEKALITDVNPIVKPPRQYSVPASVISGITEVSDIKKTLLDNDSTFGVGDDDSRSFDFDPRNNKLPLNHLDVNYRGDSQLPPDLLSFPACAAQVSPAESNASTVADQTRLPVPHGPQSPIHSPIYDTVSLYRTLPYSRSQSPFTTPLGIPIVTPRQGGYVTIPRRPRASWSSEPLGPLVADPVYDNLGLRTTASGNSALSLNKLGESGTPKGIRPPLPPKDAIPEHDSFPVSATLPRNMSASRPFSPANEIPRAAWLRNAPETSSLRSMDHSDSRRESTSSLLPHTPDGKITKIPPRPPPKPKKRVSTGPLFEDEGEDGTEV